MTDKTTLNNDTLSKTRVTVEGMMDKEKWLRPKLIVLVRGHPAESVLATCKKALPFSMPYPPGQCIVGYHRCYDSHPNQPCPIQPELEPAAYCKFVHGYDHCSYDGCCSWADPGTCYEGVHQQPYCTLIGNMIIGNS